MECIKSFASVVGVLVVGWATAASAIIIEVDYSYDTNNFFDTAAKKAAIEVAATRFSNLMTDTLTAVSPSGTGSGTNPGWRVGFTHPGTGSSYEVSTAASFGTDPLSGGGAADVYGFGGLAADEWILYAGGRALSSAAVGGTGTGTNFTSTFNDLSGPMHRGVITNTPSDTVRDLPAWGGSISFDNDGSTTWHFDTTTAAPFGTTDLYSIALHEIGHALGLSLSFNQWTIHQSTDQFSGPEAVAAYNADNDPDITSLSQVSSTNRHWEDGTYDSKIFVPGSPNLVGTVDATTTGNLQDLMMEPIANFSTTIRRLELTNVDVGALRDLGWSTLAMPEPSGCDLDGNSTCDTADMRVLYDDIAAAAIGGPSDIDGSGIVDNGDIAPWLVAAGTENGKEFKPGDTDLNGSVEGPDFTTLALNFGNTGLPGAYWDQGNFDGNEGGTFETGGSDFTGLALNFGHTSIAAVPEPCMTGALLMGLAGILGFARR